MKNQNKRRQTNAATETEQPRPRRALIVLGMHRSGTSAFTRTLSLCGAELPKHLMIAKNGVPGDGNQRAGFWESSAISALDDEVLAAAQSAWDDLAVPDFDWFQSETATTFKKKVIATLQDEFGDTPLFVVKDPRICRLVPLWNAAFKDMGVSPLWLITLRNPLEVAASLASRDGIPLSRSLLLWLQHLLAAERDTRAMNRCFVTYDGLLADWRATMTRISRELDLDVSYTTTVAGEIDTFLDRSLRHHVITRHDLAERAEVPSWLTAAFDLATQAAQGHDVDPGDFDEIAQIMMSAESVFLPLLSSTETRLTQEIEKSTELEERIDNLVHEMALIDQDKVRLTTELTTQTQHLEVATKEQDQTIGELLKLVKKMDKGVGANRGENDLLRATLEEREQNIEQLLGRIAGMIDEFAAWQEEVCHLQNTIEERDQQINELGNQIKSHADALASQNVDSDRLQVTVNERDQQINELGNQIKSLADALASQNANSDRLQITVNERDQQISELIRRLKKAGKKRRAQRDANDQLINQLYETIGSQEEKLEARATEIENLGGTIIAQRQQLAESDAAVFNVKTEISDLRSELDNVRTQVTNREQRILEIQRAFGARGNKPFLAPRQVVGLGRYGQATLAKRIPLWLLTLDPINRRKRWMETKLILESGLFDPNYYLANYPDVAESGADPCSHFVRCGAAEDRNPSPFFDTSYYLSKNPDVAESGINPLVHFIHAGASEGRSPGPHFDTTFYLQHNPDIAESGINPLLHYIETGIWEGSSPKEAAPVAVQKLAADSTLKPRTGSDAREASTAEPLRSGEQPAKGERSPQTASMSVPASPKDHPRVRTIAFYLPQFHPIPENDEWWGRGFTEWTNTSKARPLFPDHQQPQIPSELGFYDLRLPEVRIQQAELAREHGIHGFCYYYYWFGGREVLERPMWDMIASSAPDFPFCVCWANENWTRRWDGEDSEILLAQKQDPESDAAFFNAVLPAMLDPRYICLDGKPLLIIYRADLLADPVDTTHRWREAAVRFGFPGLHLCAVEFKIFDPRPFGFDGLIEFPPHSIYQQEIAEEISISDETFTGKIFDYVKSVAAVTDRPSPEYPLYRGVMPKWDNTPRRDKAAWIYHGSTPEAYGDWLDRILHETVNRPGDDDQFVFINAWNEWAEGAYLEPSLDLGRSFLEATRDAIYKNERLALQLENCSPPPVAIDANLLPWQMSLEHTETRAPDSRPLLIVSHDAARAGAQLVLLEIIKSLVEVPNIEIFLLLCGGGEVEEEFKDLVHVINLDQLIAQGTQRPQAIEKIVSNFASRNPMFALCNTVLSGKVASACQRFGIPVLSLLHELPTTIETVGTDYLFEAMAASKRVLIVSQFVKNALIRSYNLDPERLTVLHNSFFNWDPEPGWRESARTKVLQEFDLPDNTFLVMGCGSIHHRKGTDLFVQLAREVVELGGSERIFFLWIGGDQVGPTFREWCEHDIEASGLQKNVRLAGPRESASDYFAASDAFALISREDPFPMVNLEAMSRGLPVIAFAGAGGAPEVLNDGAGIVVPYLNVRAMAKAMICLSEAPHYWEEISSKAAEKMQNGYYWERYMKDLLAIFEEDFGFQRKPTIAPGTQN